MCVLNFQPISAVVQDAVSPLLGDRKQGNWLLPGRSASPIVFQRQLVQTIGSEKVWFYTFLEIAHYGVLLLPALPGIYVPNVWIIQNSQSESTGQRTIKICPVSSASSEDTSRQTLYFLPFQSPHHTLQT